MPIFNIMTSTKFKNQRKVSNKDKNTESLTGSPSCSRTPTVSPAISPFHSLIRRMELENGSPIFQNGKNFITFMWFILILF